MLGEWFNNWREYLRNICLSGALITTPAWAAPLSAVSVVTSEIASICGAIIGIYTVGRIITRIVECCMARVAKWRKPDLTLRQPVDDVAADVHTTEPE